MQTAYVSPAIISFWHQNALLLMILRMSWDIGDERLRPRVFAPGTPTRLSESWTEVLILICLFCDVDGTAEGGAAAAGHIARLSTSTTASLTYI